MKYSATIRVREDAEKLYRCFQAEKQLKTDRSSFDIKKGRNQVSFQINARDAVALRATLNSIAKLLTVYQKTSSLTKCHSQPKSR